MIADKKVDIVTRITFNITQNVSTKEERFTTDVPEEKWDYVNEKNNDIFMNQLHHRILFLEGSIDRTIFQEFLRNTLYKVCFVEYVVNNRILRTKFFTRSMFLCGSLNN